ncbi:bifunctional hydroxymethylpyrimidine kinase/phosphomethylpyrimidine kinase [Nocardioides ultimimeridianus]
MTPPVVLSIAATDSGGGAGLAADLATFAALGVHGTCVVTAVTAQDTVAVHAIHRIPLEVVAAQLDAVLADLDPAVVKTGMLGSADVVRLVAERCAGRRIVVDPVLRATTGATLADDAVVVAYRDHLLPVATVATPNQDEWRALGEPQGSHLHVTRGGDVDTTNDHGTGCTHASALAAYLALGDAVATAAARADAFVARQLLAGRSWRLGRGRGPVAHTVPNPPPEEMTA